TRDRVETGVSIGIQPTADQLLAMVSEHLQEGYRRIKIKIEPGWDVQAVGAVRERYPEIMLSADANAAYDLDDLDHLLELDRYGLLMLEQALSVGALIERAALQQRVGTPIVQAASRESA